MKAWTDLGILGSFESGFSATAAKAGDEHDLDQDRVRWPAGRSDAVISGMTIGQQQRKGSSAGDRRRCAIVKERTHRTGPPGHRTDPDLKVHVHHGFAAVALNPTHKAPKDAKVLSSLSISGDLVDEFQQIDLAA